MDIEGQVSFVDLQSFLEELVEKDMTPAKSEDIQTLPHALQELYALGEGIDLPFGYVYTIAQIQENSKIAPFFPDWLVFGQDPYGVFWVCRKEPNAEGFSFTTWDHDFETEIDAPIFADVLSFLDDLEDDYLDFMETMKSEWDNLENDDMAIE